MTPSSLSTRRQIMAMVMLVLALIGGLVRWFAPQPSLARDVGSLLMVLWLPIVGNVIGWLMQRARAPKHQLQGFAAGTVFEPHARIELTLLAADTPRLSRPIDGEPVPEVPCTLEVQFLRPELAMAQLTEGTKFALLSGRTALGTGRVLPLER